ncbi:NTP transferase domain-containing protein [Bryobacter aggregatus]|uniref:NTP transferase domain-containing protein n=1 Tax=Bryobacter aggregatus TaxID=360054 RepID=UPI0004E23467|nr:NTP transferase domain-containing protein [Bryobacter aggregatus]
MPAWPILNRENWIESAAADANPDDYSVVIAAAGRGTRLDFNKPKILFPLLGKPILEWLIELFAPRVSRLVIVLSPEGISFVKPELDRLIPGRYDIVEQPIPIGMGDAVARGLQAVKTPSVAIVWGDQAALQTTTIDAVLRLHAGPLHPFATLPTVKTRPPYIHFLRNLEGRIDGLLQAREGDSMPEEGESDVGFFCFHTQPLLALLDQMRQSGTARGAATGEFNFLPVIPLASQQGKILLTPQITNPSEAMGINSRADASRLESLLGSEKQDV